MRFTSKIVILFLFEFLHQGALNPDAEEAVTQRFHNAKTRLRNELQDQLQSRIESLDEQIESLEYIREKAELCNVEAKVQKILVTRTFMGHLIILKIQLKVDFFMLVRFIIDVDAC